MLVLLNLLVSVNRPVNLQHPASVAVDVCRAKGPNNMQHCDTKSMIIRIHHSKTAVYSVMTKTTWKVMLNVDYVEFTLPVWF